MAAVWHWVGMALGLFVVMYLLRAFWRGLSLKPTDPATRAPGKGKWWRT